jgi:hypothetical protein
MKKVFKKTKLDTSMYFHAGTGEALSNEIGDLSSINSPTDKRVITYDSYFSVNRKSIAFLSKVLSKSDLGRILVLFDLIDKPTNIIFNKETEMAMRKEELRLHIGLSVNAFRDFLKRMTKCSVIACGDLTWKNSGEFFFLNPFLARCTKTTNEKVVEKFLDLSSEKSQLIIKRLIK